MSTYVFVRVIALYVLTCHREPTVPITMSLTFTFLIGCCFVAYVEPLFLVASVSIIIRRNDRKQKYEKQERKA